MTDATMSAMAADPADGVLASRAVEMVGYDALFAAHFRGMTQLATLLGADDPEDVAQEAFAQLHRNTARLRDPDASLAYVRATVCNLSRSRLRRLRTARGRQGDLLAAPSATVEQSAVLREEHREVLAAVQRLPRRPREVLVLRYWLDMSEAQIADALGVSPGAVKSYASRGLAAISRNVEELS